ncbi:hypothetical protein FPV67DRAFT_1444732 [Lyophyllum atratum]|nr:hypothetical protein FPV67DRAFT_1444732 [Lyophyllum atratum]
MDAISTIRSLCSLATLILTWLEQTREKEEALVAVSGTVARISSILAPFQGATNLEPTLMDAFMGLGDILSRTREHVEAYRKKRRRTSVNGVISFLIPAQITKLINQDEQQLNHHLTVILFSLATISFFRDRYPMPSKNADWFTIRSVKNEDVFEFWRDYLGAKVLYAPSDRFSEALKRCFGDWLSDAARQRLSLRLDEFGVGGVAISTLERFVGEGSLKQAIDEFKAFDSLPLAVEARSDSRLPMLVWVDDVPSNNIEEVKFARDKGVNSNYGLKNPKKFLRANDAAGSIRFISDSARFEIDDQPTDASTGAYLNLTAGENVARYLRGHLYRAPLLIFCGTSIIHTQYVESYASTGSTCYSAVVRDYITALSNRAENDDAWRGFDVESSTD